MNYEKEEKEDLGDLILMLMIHLKMQYSEIMEISLPVANLLLEKLVNYRGREAREFEKQNRRIMGNYGNRKY